ncbi:MAG: CRISPR-associated endonuclease Cas2 [Proteobacteria bacterium]|nr:CRISPR-associated endonuclease Cas2 [Pseudomonadota bacterium]
MWMMVMFDLPTETKRDRHEASRFRNFLLDAGFSMAQFSVYMRFTGTRENSQKYVRMVKNNNPTTGDVNILFFTDTQFGDIIHLDKTAGPARLAEMPNQLMLF